MYYAPLKKKAGDYGSSSAESSLSMNSYQVAVPLVNAAVERGRTSSKCCGRGCSPCVLDLQGY
ncbi:hypothetical protein HZA98_03255 [Candidatus Woesearchaeota archaeon]|nr:hypothetical protein [Candidatus Woesearchaeota archaeon]